MKYFKFLIFIFLFLILPKVSDAFTCTAVAGGGNWNSAGTWTGSCNSTFPQAGDDVIFNAASGNVVVNAATAALKSLTMTGYLGTLSGAFNMTVRGLTATTQNVIFDGTITWTGSLLFSTVSSSANLNLTTNGKLLTSITAAAGTSGSVIQLQDNLSFTAAKGAFLTLRPPTLDLNGKTVSGNSSINRLLIQSSVLGSIANITVSSGTFAYTDFQYLSFANGGADLNLSAITGLSGDCGGNVMSGGGVLTFTTAQPNYWIGDSGNWSDINEWANSSGGSAASGRVPLPQDDAIFDNGSFSTTGRTVTNDMPRMGKNIDWSAYTEGQNPAWAIGTAFTWKWYGNIALAANSMTISGSGSMTNEAYGAVTVTSNGTTFGNTNTIAFNTSSQNVTLNDAYVGLSQLQIDNANFNANNFNVTVTGVRGNNNSVTNITMGSGTWTLTSTGIIWGGGMGISTVINAGTSTIIITNTTATLKTFTGFDKIYSNITITGSNVVIIGSNTFTTLALSNAGVGIGTTFTAGTTQTVRNFTANSVSTASRVFASSTSASATATIHKIGPPSNICEDFLALTWLTFSPASTWYAGTGSLDGGNNTQISFTACPTAVDSNTGTHTSTSSEKVRGGVKVRGGIKFR